ncbi:MAG: AMP-binding protein [Clostridium sp.]|nr:AMP-binding protein [Clostridium sp.]
MKIETWLHEEYQNLTVYQMLEKMTGKFCDRQLFSYWRDGQERKVSYNVFWKDVRRLAGYFDGMELCGRRIVIDGRNTYEQIVSLFAAMAMGAVAVPLCFDLPLEDLQQLHRRISPAMVIYDNEDEDILPELGLNAPIFPCMGKNSVQNILNSEGSLYKENGLIMPETPAMIQATSGSSSQAKLVVLPHRAMLHGKHEFQRSIFMLPMYHVALIPLIAHMAEGVQICLSSFRQVFFDIQWFRPHDIITVPSFVALILKRNQSGQLDLSSFNSICSCGAPQEISCYKYFNKQGVFFCSLYGATETSGAIVYSTPEHCRAGSVGKVGPWNEIQFSADGEILVRGCNIMLGYLDDPKATSEVLIDGWYHTGDIGYLDEDGFLFITGRIKNIIVLSNGENVSPEAVETKLSACKDIKEVIVLGNDDRLSAHLWCGEGGDMDTEARVRDFIAQYNKEVPSYQAIRSIVFRETPFPKTSTGKIKR